MMSQEWAQHRLFPRLEQCEGVTSRSPTVTPMEE